jgi:hypothetical protein
MFELLLFSLSGRVLLLRRMRKGFLAGQPLGKGQTEERGYDDGSGGGCCCGFVGGC